MNQADIEPPSEGIAWADTADARLVDGRAIKANYEGALRMPRTVPSEQELCAATDQVTADIRVLIPHAERVPTERRSPQLIGALSDAEQLLLPWNPADGEAGARTRMARWVHLRALARVSRVLLKQHQAQLRGPGVMGTVGMEW
ncbi:hypothetical protein [Streptomyces beijiangensis]|uniref:Uncharacterized protein n=1 Tax=Streptomyces beijiangensis TaxID=163361 RepID=A0A939JID0_9ACTN|nr:hypothetical protein [Streptomyces beijiangensis]MBO0512434.1 hypothetical protein [Streptomyces beijiangensis]